MSATDDPTQGFGDEGDDPTGSGGAQQEHEDPTEGGEAGEDPTKGGTGEGDEDPTEGGEFGEDPTA